MTGYRQEMRADLGERRAQTGTPVIDSPETEANARRVALRHLAIRALANGLVPFNACFGDREREGFGILMYHRCCRSTPGVVAPTLNVTPDRFEAQMRGILNRGYRIRPLSEIADQIAAGHWPDRKTVAVTFDDGYACMHSEVLPIARKLSIPVSVFVCTSYFGSERAMPFDRWGQRVEGDVDPRAYRSMNEAECREMVESGLVDIGAHTHTHEDFRGRADAFRDDLEQNVKMLESEFQISKPTFAFPFGTPALGYASPELVAAAKQLGVRVAVTTAPAVNRPAADPFQLARFNVFEWDTAATLAARLNGWYSWLPAASAAVRQVLRNRRAVNSPLRVREQPRCSREMTHAEA